MGRTHLDPKSKKKCILFSSIFNVDRPFQRYLLKTSGPGENNPITKRKNNFFSKFPRCKISTSTFSEIGKKENNNGFGVWSGPFFLTWVHLKGSVLESILDISESCDYFFALECCQRKVDSCWKGGAFLKMSPLA